MSAPRTLPQFIEAEPVTSLSVGFSLIFNSVLVALPVFGIGLDWEEMVALATVFNTVLAVVTLAQRQRVTPVSKANDRIAEAYVMEPGVADPPLIK
jgi:hypothetical protein